jgi:hypothetical protein
MLASISSTFAFPHCTLDIGLQAKQRARFFQLVDVFLSSSLIPAYTVAAFAKRFARLALTASPAGVALKPFPKKTMLFEVTS